MPSFAKEEADALPLLSEERNAAGATTPHQPSSGPSWAPRAALATTILMVGGSLAVAGVSAWNQGSSNSAAGGAASSPDFHLVTSGNVNYNPSAAHVEPEPAEMCGGKVACKTDDDDDSSEWRPARGSSGAGDNDDGHDGMPGHSKTNSKGASKSEGKTGSKTTASKTASDPASVDRHHWDLWTTNGDGYGNIVSVPNQETAMLDLTNDQKEKTKKANLANNAHKKDNVKNNNSGKHHKTTKGSDASEDAGTSDSSNTVAADGSSEGRRSGVDTTDSGDMPDKGPPDGSEGTGMPGKGLDASDDQPNLPTGPGGNSGNSVGSAVVSDAEAEASAAKTTTDSPNVVFVLFDDVGYNDFGYSSTDLKAATPTITKLGKEGVILSRYYTEPDCTPARSTILSGRLPITSGMSHSIVDLDSPWGLPTSHKLISEQMKSAGYQTHLYGKWDIGHHDPAYWPTQRGFDSYFGLLVKTYTGSNSYETHACGTGYTDLVNDMDNAYGHSGNYSTTMFGDAAAAQVMAHDPSLGPLFMYIAFNAMHAPVSLPDEFTESDEYATITEGLTWSKRKEFAAGLYVGDQAINNVVVSLKARGMYEDTVIIATSDNGGPSNSAGGPNGANNYPLRGYKGNVFDGGMRVPAFIHYPNGGPAMNGTTLDFVFHAADWYPTLVNGLAAKDWSLSSDGVNQWDMVTGAVQGPVRNETLLWLDYMSSGWGAILLGDYKFMKQGCKVWYDTDGSSYSMGDEDCSGDDDDVSAYYRIYNVATDPEEQYNLYGNADYADIQATLEERYCYYYNEVMTDNVYQEADKTGAFTAMEANDNFLTYWLENTEASSLYPKSDYTFDLCAAYETATEELKVQVEQPKPHGEHVSTHVNSAGESLMSDYMSDGPRS